VLCLRQTQALLLCSSTAIFTEGHNCRHLTRNYLHHCLSVAAGCWRLAAGGWLTLLHRLLKLALALLLVLAEALNLRT